MFRLILVTLLIALSIVVPFALWGGDIEQALSVEHIIERLRATGWAWAAGIALITADVFLPTPSKPVMAALGILYGPLLGGLFSVIGTVLAGCLGYGLCRAIPRPWTERFIGPKALRETDALFDRWGFALVALSRWLPVLPELVSFFAGLAQLSFWRFLLALVCGAVPLGFLMATAGHLGRETPLLVLILSAVLPVLIWAVARAIRQASSPTK